MGKTIKVFAVCFLLCFLSGCSMNGLFSREAEHAVYDTLRDNGYTASEEELEDSLKEEVNREVKTWNSTESAYDKAVNNGYSGTKADWLNTLLGTDVNENEYTDGKSVYEIAVDSGYNSTVENWLESLKEHIERPTVKETIASSENHNTTAEPIKDVTENLSTTGETVKEVIENKETTENTTEANEVSEEKIFTVTFKDYDGTVIKIDKVKKGEGAIPPPTPQREGYDFVRWDRTFANVQDDLIVNAVFKEITEPTIIVQRVDAESDSKNVAVTISVKNNPGVASLNLIVAFDSSLTFKKVEYNKAIGGNSMKPGSEESPVKLVWVSPFEDVKGDWVFATLYFDVSDDAAGDLPVCITYKVDDIYNLKEENIYFDIVDGAVAISK